MSCTTYNNLFSQLGIHDEVPRGESFYVMCVSFNNCFHVPEDYSRRAKTCFYHRVFVLNLILLSPSNARVQTAVVILARE